MKKLILALAVFATLGLAACTSRPTESGDSSATAPATTAPAPAASCGAGGKACG